MTADIEPYAKAKTQEDAELPGLILIVAMTAILLTLVLFFS
ncbi:hypothetical protein SAMN04487968_10174 [Nocardioides terrae]|uniref:Flagellin N-terminal-like domain-containing protein n=1 Tax=Nocardioides terrae TaxID=574651 RepID=A0A1I1DD63_9ACTN|nr:hypothetical protein [Nocardioides terrae]SFB71008.1 hypothetical protein SAMN04487968_10174 [Nocardioides terrae]